jgi:phosphohistidine phosphatase SixA
MRTVILLRHADIDVPSGPASDEWPLNAAGQERARALAHVAGDAGITGIFVSDALRTAQTVQPLAARLSLQPRPTPPPVQLAQVLMGEAGAALIAGHSNTVPAMIAALGAASPVQSVSGHDDLFVVTVRAPGDVHLVCLKYGAPTPH